MSLPLFHLCHGVPFKGWSHLLREFLFQDHFWFCGRAGRKEIPSSLYYFRLPIVWCTWCFPTSNRHHREVWGGSMWNGNLLCNSTIKYCIQTHKQLHLVAVTRAHFFSHYLPQTRQPLSERNDDVFPECSSPLHLLSMSKLRKARRKLNLYRRWKGKVQFSCITLLYFGND